jgi:hypothetical protein
MTDARFVLPRAFLIAAIAVGALSLGVPARAQEQAVAERPVSFGVGLGVAAAPGRSVGPLALGTLGVNTPWRSLDVRLDGAFTSWPGVSGGRLTSLTGNLVYSPRTGVFSPYVIGGIGGYAEQGTGASFGINAGVGIKASLWRVRPFVELREHVWSADRSRRATPLTVGFMF